MGEGSLMRKVKGQILDSSRNLGMTRKWGGPRSRIVRGPDSVYSGWGFFDGLRLSGFLPRGNHQEPVS